jgi:hypothetical protein
MIIRGKNLLVKDGKSQDWEGMKSGLDRDLPICYTLYRLEDWGFWGPCINLGIGR